MADEEIVIGAKKRLIDLDMDGNEIQNAVDHNLQSAPQNPKEGQFYWNTVTKKDNIWDGLKWVDRTKTYTFTDGVSVDANDQVTLDTASDSAKGGVIVGTNIDVSDGTISVKTASTSDAGIIQIATSEEATLGTNTTKAVTPKELKDGLDLKVDLTSLGIANGVATLDNSGKVPSAQLPSFVDDVVDSYIVGSTALAADWLSETISGEALTPETDKIYVILTSGDYLNRTYRWSGTTYVEISASPGQATESTRGIARIATTSQVATGTDDETIITPLKLAGQLSTEASATRTLTNKTIDADNNTVSNLELDNFKSGVARTSLRDVSNATDTSFVTEKGIATALTAKTGKFSVPNPLLTASGGACIWTITNTLGTDECICMVKEVSSNEVVEVGQAITASTITIVMNSSADIAANTYKAIVIG